MISRPVIIVCPPRSGSSLLFETLSRSPDLFSVGGESHHVIEGVPTLHPRARGWASNRLLASDADHRTVRVVRRRFHARLRDRDRRRPASPARPLRLLEKTPRNALRVPFLRAAFPQATFVYLYRDPTEVMSSMLDGWRAGRFVSYPRLPGWPRWRDPWSFLLVPGWRAVAGEHLAGVVAHQWRIATSVLLDDLEATVPADQRLVVRFGDLVADPPGVVRHLCDALDLAWDRPISGPLPWSGSTLTPPGPDKWRRNAHELGPMLDAVAAVAGRAAAFAGEPAGRPLSGRDPTGRRAPADGAPRSAPA